MSNKFQIMNVIAKCRKQTVQPDEVSKIFPKIAKCLKIFVYNFPKIPLYSLIPLSPLGLTHRT